MLHATTYLATTNAKSSLLSARRIAARSYLLTRNPAKLEQFAGLCDRLTGCPGRSALLTMRLFLARIRRRERQSARRLLGV